MEKKTTQKRDQKHKNPYRKCTAKLELGFRRVFSLEQVVTLRAPRLNTRLLTKINCARAAKEAKNKLQKTESAGKIDRLAEMKAVLQVRSRYPACESDFLIRTALFISCFP